MLRNMKYFKKKFLLALLLAIGSDALSNQQWQNESVEISKGFDKATNHNRAKWLLVEELDRKLALKYPPLVTIRRVLFGDEWIVYANEVAGFELDVERLQVQHKEYDDEYLMTLKGRARVRDFSSRSISEKGERAQRSQIEFEIAELESDLKYVPRMPFGREAILNAEMNSAVARTLLEQDRAAAIKDELKSKRVELADLHTTDQSSSGQAKLEGQELMLLYLRDNIRRGFTENMFRVQIVEDTSGSPVFFHVVWAFDNPAPSEHLNIEYLDLGWDDYLSIANSYRGVPNSKSVQWLNPEQEVDDRMIRDAAWFSSRIKKFYPNVLRSSALQTDSSTLFQGGWYRLQGTDKNAFVATSSIPETINSLKKNRTTNAIDNQLLQGLINFFKSNTLELTISLGNKTTRIPIIDSRKITWSGFATIPVQEDLRVDNYHLKLHWAEEG